ncbi:MAG: CHAT domain-containing protein [Blastocatellia bacterium]|nr:CHAT domain-containing protein [Blastocatellia bacterium]
MRRPGDAIATAARRRAACRCRGAASVRSAITLALAAALGAGGVVVVEWAVSPDRNRQSSMVVELLDGRRVANGRLTGGAPFAEYTGPVRLRMRGGAGSAQSSTVSRPGARAAEVLAEGVERPTGAALRAVGVLRLAEGRYRLASATLERAREAAPTDARIAADLAVALLEESIGEDVPRLAARALAVADEAIALDPFVDEAWFTRAAALEHLWIGPAAVQAWYDYLGRDEGSAWSVEARRRVCALEQLANTSARVEARRRFETAIAEGNAALAEAVAREYPSEARRVATDLLVKDWPAAVFAGSETEGRRREGELRAAADAIFSSQQDRFFVDAVTSIRSSIVGGDLRSLAQGLAAYSDGREAFRRGELQLAAKHFEDASVQLTAAGCEAVATLAEFDAARCEIYSREYDSVLRRLETLRPASERRGYRHLAARAWWVSGYVHAVRFDVAPALGQLRQALDELDAVGDVEGSAIVGLLLAETSHWYGLGDEAWDYGRRALAALSRLGSTGQASVGFSGIAILAGADGEVSASKCLLDAAGWAAAGAGDSSSEAAAMGLRAVMHLRRGDRVASSSDLSSARDAALRVSDPLLSRLTGREVDLCEAEVSVTDAPDRAVELLTLVLAAYERTNDRVRTVQCLRLRAAAHLSRGDGDAALLDLEAAVRELDEQRRRLNVAELRARLGAEVDAVFGAVIEMQFQRLANPDGAFEYLERKRTWERSERDTVRPPSSSDVAATLEVGETVLVYSAQAGALRVWAIDRNGAAFARTEIGADRIAELVERFRRGVEHGDASELPQLSDPLVEALWRPVEERIPEDATVTIVGDAAIRGLPFGALVDSRTGRFLIQRNAFAVARSVRDVVRRSESTIAPDGPVLVVGDPEFDTARHPGLARLSSAEDEARAVASMYGSARVLLAGEATVQAFREGVGKAAIIHYAGHAVDNLEGRGESSLLLAGGFLTASEVARMRLDGVRLTVLAACGTSAGGAGPEGSIGSESLAEAFLDAGVEEVVASHWAVSDDATAEMLVEFHRRLRVGESTAAALRGAVLSVIGGPDGGGIPPRDWAAFGVIQQ